MPKPAGQAPREQGQGCHTCKRNGQTNAGKALELTVGTNTNFLSQHTPEQKSVLPVGDAARQATESQTARGGLRCSQGPGSPEKTVHPPPPPSLIPNPQPRSLLHF